VTEIIQNIIPLVLLFAVGLFFRKIGVFKPEDGDLLLKVVFYIALPALLLLSVARARLTWGVAFLPLISAGVIFLTYLFMLATSKPLRVERMTRGVMLVGAMILNVGFIIPFVMTAYGEEGLARLMIFDLGNGFMVFTFVYYQACKYGGGPADACLMRNKLLKSPPLWALVAGVALNLLDVEIPNVAVHFLEIAGDLTVPLLMLVIGFFFHVKVTNLRALLLVIFIRMGAGLLIGLAIVNILGLEGLLKNIVVLGCATPVGYNTLTFTSLENLDREFAAGLVSISVLAGMVYVPLLIFLLSL
jgi:predicted permease